MLLPMPAMNGAMIASMPNIITAKPLAVPALKEFFTESETTPIFSLQFTSLKPICPTGKYVSYGFFMTIRIPSSLHPPENNKSRKTTGMPEGV